MDEADQAQLLEESMRAEAIERVRREAKYRHRTHCSICEEKLLEYRRPFGMCVDCAREAERCRR